MCVSFVSGFFPVAFSLQEDQRRKQTRANGHLHSSQKALCVLDFFSLTPLYVSLYVFIFSKNISSPVEMCHLDCMMAFPHF